MASPGAVTAVGADRATWFAPTLRHYRRSMLGRDVVAGLSAGAVVVPQAMAYATIADLPVQYGLYTCMLPLVVYAFLGGSRAMSVSTTSTIATLTATTMLGAGITASSADRPRALVTLTLLVGVVLLLARVFRLGSLVENINQSTLLGVQIGVGATVAVGQLPKMLGTDGTSVGHGFLRSVVAVVESIPHANPATMILSAASIALLLALRRWARRVPGPLVVVALGIVASVVLGLPAVGVQRIAAVPSGLPVPVLPDVTLTPALLPGVFAIATMAFLESAAVARGIRRPGEPQIDSDRELLATAAASIVGSFTQTLPAAGGFSQSAVNQAAGARSQAAGLTTAALAVVVALFLGPVLGQLPEATLSALVIVAVVGLIDVPALVLVWRISRRDFWLAALTAAVGLTAGLLPAVLVGVLGTFFLILRELQRVRLVALGQEDGHVRLLVDGPMYTANVLEYERAVLHHVDGGTAVRTVTLDLSRLRQLSVTVIDALRDLDRELAEAGVQLRVAGLSGAARAMAERTAWYRGLESAGRTETAGKAAAD